MEHRWKHAVLQEEDGMTVEKLLRKAGFSKKEISRQKFITEGILLDGKKCRTTVKVRSGQVLELCFEEEKQTAAYVRSGESRGKKQECSWKILYEDEDVLLADKPSSLSCHPGRGHFFDNLGTQVLEYCREKGDSFSLRQVGRLDRDTSGIVLFAKNRTAAARLWKQRADGRLKKTYQVLVHGRFSEKEGVIDLPMAQDGKRMRVCMDGGLRAITRYCTEWTGIYKGSEVSLLSCRLDTGRTHQIRVHMAASGHPVVGDPVYGKMDEAERMFLHAGKLSFYQPFSGEYIERRSAFSVKKDAGTFINSEIDGEGLFY